MFQNTIISNELPLHNFFKKLNFDLYLTKPQIKHLENIMNAMISKGFNGKISDVAELAPARHRTSTTRFLSNSSWDEKLLDGVQSHSHQAKGTNKSKFYKIAI